MASMIIHVDANDPRPIYRQVADEIRALIASGALRTGDALPPVRQVAADLGVNLNTIATAYRELQDEGLITVRHGARALVASRTTSTARGTKESESRELRRSLRTVLTKLVLAGLPRSQIMSQVSEELRELTKGSR